MFSRVSTSNSTFLLVAVSLLTSRARLRVSAMNECLVHTPLASHNAVTLASFAAISVALGIMEKACGRSERLLSCHKFKSFSRRKTFPDFVTSDTRHNTITNYGIVQFSKLTVSCKLAQFRAVSIDSISNSLQHFLRMIAASVVGFDSSSSGF